MQACSLNCGSVQEVDVSGTSLLYECGSVHKEEVTGASLLSGLW